MERSKKMIEDLSETMDEVLELRINQIINSYEDQKENVIWELKKILYGLVRENVSCLVITYLRSSYITGSHKFQIAAYEEEPFVEEYPNFSSFSLGRYYAGADKDVDGFINEMKKKYIRLLPSETEEIRRYYMGRLYQGCMVLFERIRMELGKEKDFSTLPVYFGEEMGELTLLGAIKDPNSNEICERKSI